MGGKINVGDTVSGKITGIQPYGAFVKIGDKIDGLIHISEIANGFISDIKEYLQINAEVTAKVIGINERTGNLSLSTKDLISIKAEPSYDRKKRQDLEYIKQLEKDNGFEILRKNLEKWIEEASFDNVK